MTRPSEISGGTGLPKLSYRAHPHLYEINTWVWLEQLSAKYGRRLRLKEVPDGEWDSLSTLGFDFIYLMGVWRRSVVGRRIFRTNPRSFPEFDGALPGWKMADVVGSPYSIQDYSPDPRIGTFEDLDAVHHRLRTRGMGLILDFVPNHTGFDHVFVEQHPDYYILGSEEDFRRDPASFYLAERGDEICFVACGKDPYFPPWTDVAQLNHFNPACRQALIGVLKSIAQHCDGVRCDMAMLDTNEVFSRTWGRFLQKWPVPPTEFWTDAVAAIPGLIWMAEVYWDLEWKMQQLGFQFTYDKRLYDRLAGGAPAEVRGHMQADLGYQNKLVRFLENHDENRCSAAFPRERIPSLALLVSTLPGMHFFHHGQFEGAKIHVPMPLARAAGEPVDQALRQIYERALRIASADAFHAGEWKLLEVRPAGDDSFEDLLAYRWQLRSDCKLIVINLGGRSAQGRVQQAEPAGDLPKCVYRDELDNQGYVWDRTTVAHDGLYVRLGPYQAHAFSLSEAGG